MTAMHIDYRCATRCGSVSATAATQDPLLTRKPNGGGKTPPPLRALRVVAEITISNAKNSMISIVAALRVVATSKEVRVDVP
ncbi:MAG: hypothetical protein AB1448_11215 [Pseudomonadota bacterium]